MLRYLRTIISERTQTNYMNTTRIKTDYELIDMQLPRTDTLRSNKITAQSREGSKSARRESKSASEFRASSAGSVDKESVADLFERDGSDPVVFALSGNPPDPKKTIFELQFSKQSVSVFSSILLRMIISTAWSFIWCAVYYWSGFTQVATANALIIVLGVVLSLLLVFRTNTAYDRYWEARKIWVCLVFTFKRCMLRY